MNETIIVKRPSIARDRRKASNLMVAAVCGSLGLLVFSSLALARSEQNDGRLPSIGGAVSTPAVDTAVPEAPAPITPTVQTAATPYVAPGQQSATLIPNSPSTSMPITSPGYALPTAPRPATDNMAARMHAPSLVIDFTGGKSQQYAMAQTQDSGQQVDDSGGRVSTSPSTVFVPGRNGGSGASYANPSSSAGLNDTEQFAQRVGGEETGVSKARQMVGLDRMVPQGAVMGAVMETALNSDQPGYARAMIQRDVYSFDGSAVLIPAGSRVIGQYKSGVAQGASRLFIVWTRLIRPDGVSVELASPATDELGRGGLGGKVNRHFFQRFGGSILTSVLSGALYATSAGASRGTTILVGSAGQASSLAGEASRSNDIPPTITTKQGAPVRIFVARDLDFSLVGPAK